MKTIATIILFVCCFDSLITKAQTDSYGIDPRQFFRVYEQRKQDQYAKLLYGKEISQKRHVCDNKSKIFIEVDVDSLARNIEFVGSLMIKAKINSNNIEVAGYSQIGERISSGGNLAISTKNFASSILGLLAFAEKYNPMFDMDISLEPIDILMLKNDAQARNNVETKMGRPLYILQSEYERQIASTIVKSILKSYPDNKQKEKLDAGTLERLVYIKSPKIFDELIAYNNLDTVIYKNGKYNPAAKTNLTPQYIIEFINDYILFYDEANAFIANGNKTKLDSLIYLNAQFKLNKLNTYLSKFINLELTTVDNYLAYFTRKNIKESEALSEALHSNPVAVDNITKSLKGYSDTLRLVHQKLNKAYLTIQTNDVASIQSRVEEINTLINTTQLYMGLFKQKMSELAFLSKEALKIGKDAIAETKDTATFNLESETNTLDAFYQNSYVRDLLVERIAYLTGLNIYKRLITGTIDLQQANAAEGDVVRIRLIWLQEGLDGDTISTVELPLAEFTVKEVGWTMSVSDGLLVVNHINSDKLDPEDSPSRFKGAYGASLMFNYTSDKSAIEYKDTPRHSLSMGVDPKLKDGKVNYRRGLRFLESFQPSVGINLASLDFSNTKDFELGCGVIVGLFRNKVFVSYGYNLSLKDSPWYWGLGFSFVNLTGIFTGTPAKIPTQ